MNGVPAKAIDKKTEWKEEDGIRYRGTDIVSVTVAEGVTHIPDGAFEGCASLERIDLSDTLESIGKDAFRGCSKLRVPALPASLREIGEGAFFGCTSVEEFKADAENVSFKVRRKALYKGHTLIAYPAGCADKEFDIPDDTLCISDFAFSGNPHINAIRLGSKVRSVTAKAFSGCRKLSKIRVSAANDDYISLGDALYSDSGKTLVFVPPAPRRLFVRLMGVENLAPSCMAECCNIDSIHLHDCLETIAPDAFGDSCRPKKVYVDTNFDCGLPFGIDMDDMEIDSHSGGAIFRRKRDGRYEFIGFMPPSEERFDEFDEPSVLMYGDCEVEDSQFLPVKVDDTSFSDIAGLEDAKQAIYRSLILPAKNLDLFERFGLETSTGVLLYGPPGTGKTMLARAVASEVDAKFYSIKSSDIRNCYVGGSEENIRKLFETARNDRRAVIFFDDFDSLGRSRGNGHEPWQSDLIDELLVQMQGIEKHHGSLIVLAATNRPWEIDSALMRSGRFSTHIHVGLPNMDAREIIIRNCISNAPLADDVDLRYVASRTEGYNGADVEEMCKAAKMRRVCLIDAGDKTERITASDFEYALSTVHSSVSRKDLREIEQYRRTGRGPDLEGDYTPTDGILPGYW